MAKDKETYDSYAKDVFDNPPAGPVGVHRGARSAGARMTPFLIVLLVVALAASAHGVCCRECSPTCSSGTTARRRRPTTRRPTAATRRPATRRSPARASSPLLVRLTVPPTRLPIPPRIPPRAIRHRAAATVRPMPPTRTGRGGLHRLVRRAVDAAGHRRGEQGHFRPRDQRNQDLRSRRQPCVHAQAGGYKNVVSANPSGTLPASTVVWYQNETDAATAKDIAVTLGISDVRQMSGISAPVVVVLMQ